MSYTQWNIPRGRAIVPPGLIEAGFTSLLAAVLQVRGYDTPERAGDFLDISERLLGDPLMLEDMPQAVMRLTRAIAEHEKVAVYGDYDVDGITSSCMLADYLRSRGLACELYIPNRLDEGYGVKPDAIRTLRERGVSLIVTVDCGITTVDEAKIASDLGIDMIITDHHECRKDADGNDELPDAIAVIDPKRSDCNYPSHDLAGVGVAFKLLCALEGSAEPVLTRYADLVAVGTIADVMPLIGENRYIVRKGLDKLRDNPRPGLRALIEAAGLGEKIITATHIGFTIAPRLNASGRLGQVGTAVNLLTSTSQKEVRDCAEALCSLNHDRQVLERDIWEEAREMLGETIPNAPIVLAHDGWHQGVIGIAASRLTEAYGVPAIMICLDEEKGKGSCRSCGGFNLFEALSACSQYLEGYGGHALAAGLTIKAENIDPFRAALAEYYHAHPTECVSTLELDLCVDAPEMLSLPCVEDLELIEPCGAGNPRPLLCLEAAMLRDVIPIGGGRHLRLQIDKFGQTYEAVFFNHTEDSLGLRPGDCMDVAFFPQVNDFRGRRSVQLLIHSLRPHDAGETHALLDGALPEGIAAFTPDRSDFARLWRALSSHPEGISARAEQLFELLGVPGRTATLCLCLKVFQELGLAELHSDGDCLSVRCLPCEGKAKLDDSSLLRKLQQ